MLRMRPETHSRRSGGAGSSPLVGCTQRCRTRRDWGLEAERASASDDAATGAGTSVLRRLAHQVAATPTGLSRNRRARVHRLVGSMTRSVWRLLSIVAATRRWKDPGPPVRRRP